MLFINEVPNSAELPAIIINELRDIYGIKYRKDKKIKSTQQSGHHKIFGVPLKELEFTEVKLSNESPCQIPLFVSDACARIMEKVETEGIFRKAGSSSRQKEIRDKLELGMPIDDTSNIIDIANIVKFFFRELPEPLLPPGNFQETILRCLLCKGSSERKVAAIKMVCLLLPTAALNTLVYFMQFLNFVSLHSSENKMSAKNLAIIFTPGLMPINENYGQRLASHVQIIEILIENAHEIGLVPTDLLNRISNVALPEAVGDSLNFTMISRTNSRRSMDPSHIKVPETDIKKKKKRRSGSLTRMFNGIRKIVGAMGSSDNLDESHDTTDVQSTPCLNKSKKRKAAEVNAFSSKKKKDVLALLPSGGILPSTPMCNKPTKKSRLSLGGKRYTKNNTNNQSTGTKSSLVSSLERRWSFMSGSRQSQKHTLSTTQDTSIISSDKPATATEKHEPWESIMTKSEYEEIKERVAAIETRISKEFIKLESPMLNNSMESIDTHDLRGGPERVLEKFERTKEQTEMMNATPMTEQLAKHLSRGLKIRSSCENKVIRSPSARKIGSIRRRSQENVRLSRNKSWHLGANAVSPVRTTRATRNSPLKPSAILNTPNIEKHIQIPRANLKRGRPNTFQNGLRTMQTTPPKPAESSAKEFSVTENAVENVEMRDNIDDLQNERWICADIFFDGGAIANQIDESALNSSKNSVKSATKAKPVRKRLNMNVDTTPTQTLSAPPNGTPNRSSNSVSIQESTLKTPMLPPRLPVLKKTPTTKTPHPGLSTLAVRNIFTPLWQQEQQQIAGRASIARLRSQNAGMVMAKAKLFDGLVVEPTVVNKTKAPTKLASTVQSQMHHDNILESKHELDTTLRTRFNHASRKTTDSPRRNNKNGSNGVQRRQQLRNHRHTPKKTPTLLDTSMITLSGSGNRGKHASPATATNTSVQSPMTRRMAAIDATPHSKRTTLITKPPRRIIRTPQSKRKPN